MRAQIETGLKLHLLCMLKESNDQVLQAFKDSQNQQVLQRKEVTLKRERPLTMLDSKVSTLKECSLMLREMKTDVVSEQIYYKI